MDNHESTSAITSQPLIGKEELARRLGVPSTKFIDAAVRRKIIPVLKLGRRTVRFDWPKVQKALERLEIKALV